MYLERLTVAALTLRSEAALALEIGSGVGGSIDPPRV
jgi:hypothetical protein